MNRDTSDALFAAGVEAWKKYEETYESQYLAEAVQNHQAALDIRVPDHPRRPESLWHTAMALWAHCQGAVSEENSSTVIAYYDEALLLLSDKPGKLGSRANISTNLGMVYLTLFRLGKENPEAFPAAGSNIDKAINNYRSALRLRRAKNDPDRPTSLINLGIALVQKDSKDYLMNAIINLREAVELCTRKPTANRRLLLLAFNNLAQAYDGYYRYSKDMGDVFEKVSVLQRVLYLTDEGKGRLVPLVNLMNARWRLYELGHSQNNHLAGAVLCGREPLKLSDASFKIPHVISLITHADFTFAHYFQTNLKDVTHLDEAIRYYRKAINHGHGGSLDPDTRDGSNPVLFSSLASAIYIRCQDFEEVEGATLEDAISYCQEALHSFPKVGRLYLKIQTNLGSIYLTRFNKLGAEGDLVKAIQAYEDVVSHCPDVDDDFTFYQEALEHLKRALQEQQKPETWVSISTKFKLRRRQSVANSWRSRQSSDESCPSSSASTISTD